MQWVYSGAVSGGGQALAIRMVPAGGGQGGRGRGTPEEGHEQKQW